MRILKTIKRINLLVKSLSKSDLTFFPKQIFGT